ncbi:AfsR/SARP family transcriptional regulator [Streptomyces sp. YU58]|uniref:AfsR/SARP family transcriptional regulator n=1 Tax=Streptomyces sp. SX92 TaxID=3158972 RepID=UPI0027B8C749|nr:BTAD domain-containing putative transcriptional regulator [Streptomyces coralus]WLW51147.1 BTAD domain-containing putative transcriptional regulator [Streptomyces coralus]
MAGVGASDGERVEIGLLGPVRLSVGGVARPLRSLPGRVLLAHLALGPGRVVPVAELIDALWDAEPPRGAVGNLHSYVSRLRRALGDDLIAREAAGYRLLLDPDRIDTGLVERLVAEARSAAVADPAEGARLLGRALGVWRGEALADLTDRTAFTPERARLDEWRRHLREEWFELRLAAGEAGGVLPDLEEAVASDPLRERLQLLFVQARHRTGRTAEALAAVDAYRRRLADEYGLDPGPAMAELRQRLLTDDPGLRGPGARGRGTRGQGTATGVPAASGARLTERASAGSRAASGPASGLAAGSAGASGPSRPLHTPDAPDALAAAGAPRLTPPADRFVGRKAELAQVRDAVREHRTVTVVGPGGVGKTRLVLELLKEPVPLSARLQAPSSTPLHLVELAEVSRSAEVAGAVATRLGLRTAPEGDVTAVADRLGHAEALLVLDNCEHLSEAARDLVTELSARCRGLRVLATSRRRLDVPGERVVRLGPPSEEEQVELFCDRAALLRDGFREDLREDRAASAAGLVAEVCRMLDGLPLAVELAARREAVFGLRQLRERLSAGLDVLEPVRGGDRATAVTATVEWSRRLLDPDARDLLDRLSVCRGGFGAEAVDHLTPPGAARPAALLAELVDASLVGCDLTADPPRYRLLETVRHACAAHLAEALAEDAHAAHARWMLAHAERVHQLRRDRSPEAAVLFRRERANTHEALSWLAGTGRRQEAARLALMTAMALADDPDLPLLGLLGGLAPALPGAPGDDTEALFALASGVAAWLTGDGRTSDRLLGAAVEALPDRHPHRWIGRFYRLANRMYRGDVTGVEEDATALLHDRAAPGWGQGSAVCCAALTREFAGDHESAERWLTRQEVLLTELSRLDGFVTYTRGELAAQHDPALALALFDRAHRQCRAQGNVYVGEIAAVGRAAVLIRLGRHEEAVAACHELLGGLRRLGMWPQLWMVLRLTAELMVALGDHATAAALFTAADSDSLAPAVFGADRELHAGMWRRIAEALGPERLESSRAEGRADGRAGAAERAMSALAATLSQRPASRGQGTGKRAPAPWSP